MDSAHGQVTFLLQEWSQGDSSALDKLTPLIYSELRKLARSHMRKESQGHTIQPTALVNEAYLRLAGMKSDDWPNRKCFLAAASQIMRRVLVDYARKKRSHKRGSGHEDIPIEKIMDLPGPLSAVEDLLTFDDAMRRLESLDERKARAIDMSLFGGCTISEIAETLNVGVATVHRDLEFARVWLAREIGALKAHDEGTLERH